MESFLEDAERTAAAEDHDKQDADAEDRLGEGLHPVWHVALSCCAAETAWLVTHLLHVTWRGVESGAFSCI